MSHIDLMKKKCSWIIIVSYIWFKYANLLIIKFWYYGSLFGLWKMPRFLFITSSITCISKTFVTILFPELKTWHVNFLVTKGSYCFKKIILLRRWHCIVYKFFLFFVLYMLNHWWRQCIEAIERNNLFKK